jgi:DNA-directed RNA polymerase subunit M/transcription elongation factor TFIIS
MSDDSENEQVDSDEDEMINLEEFSNKKSHFGVRRKKKLINVEDKYKYNNLEIEKIRENSLMKLSRFNNKKKSIEKEIFNFSVLTFSDQIGHKMKTSELELSGFKQIYSLLLFDILCNETDTPNEIIKNIKNKNTGISSPSFADEIGNDDKETFVMTHPFKVVIDGIYTCNKCKSKKIFIWQMQTRSADEPITTFCTCINCQNKWKE